MKIKVCPKCGTQNAESAWSCQNASCGEMLPMSTLVEAAGGEQTYSPPREAFATAVAAPPPSPGTYVERHQATVNEPSRSRSGRLEVSGTGVAAFILSVIALFAGTAFLVKGVSGGPEGVIRLSQIYLGLGLLLQAAVLALWGIAEQLGRFWKHWRRAAEGR